ncbi:MAG TPA: 2-dehydropantoate 2-reductase [Archaeoglobaceae archaeon]|nr:2-dehydropantoate 2-reductase [Archaeoglobaceae archaeon]
MKILVFGAGAIGSVIGGFLANAGHDVTFLGRKWHVDIIRENGLFITGIWGDHLIDSIRTATEISQLDSDYDLILITVKSYSTDEAGKAVRDLLNEKTYVIHLQNGLGNAETLLKYIPPDRLITGRVIFGVEIEPGCVRVTVSADETVLGSISGSPLPEIKKFADVLSRAGISARITAEIEKYVWAKALYNCALNPLATILEVPYGFLAENPFTREIMDRVIDEIYEVGKKMGVKFEPETAVEYRQLFYSKLIPVTAEHHASMLQDIKMGKKTEIDALCGAIARYGKEYGVKTPVNSLLTDLIRAKEIRQRT